MADWTCSALLACDSVCSAIWEIASAVFSTAVTIIVRDSPTFSESRGERPRRLRIWSAGCATGAEAYTIAICLRENLFRLRDWSLAILATDISEEALRDARTGV